MVFPAPQYDLPPEEFLRQLYDEYREDCVREGDEPISYEEWLTDLKTDFSATEG